MMLALGHCPSQPAISLQFKTESSQKVFLGCNIRVRAAPSLDTGHGQDGCSKVKAKNPIAEKRIQQQAVRQSGSQTAAAAAAAAAMATPSATSMNTSREQQCGQLTPCSGSRAVTRAELFSTAFFTSSKSPSLTHSSIFASCSAMLSPINLSISPESEMKEGRQVETKSIDQLNHRGCTTVEVKPSQGTT